jgi:lipoprotein-anchoring transpeptidase ErfK/SrfK
MKNKYFNQFLIAGLLFFVLSLVFLKFDFGKNEPEVNDQVSGCNVNDLTGAIDYSETYAYFEGKKAGIPKVALANDETRVLGLANEERWVEIDLSDQKLYAWEGNNMFLETLVSTGLPWYPTPTGEFRIWIKLRATKMEGGSGSLYYYLPNVPYVMYFGNSKVPNWRGYGLHGTYWHSDFGTQRSHGCVNLPTEIAKQLYYWVGPVLSEGKSTVWADSVNTGTRVVIHD